MESTIKVRITPKKVADLFNNYDKIKLGTIKFYKFLGIDEVGDFNPNKCTDEEWKSIRDVECIYEILFRHIEVSKYLNENIIYKSWNGVMRALKRRVINSAFDNIN